MGSFLFVLINLQTKTASQKPANIPLVNYGVIGVTFSTVIGMMNKWGPSVNPAQAMA